MNTLTVGWVILILYLEGKYLHDIISSLYPKKHIDEYNAAFIWGLRATGIIFIGLGTGFLIYGLLTVCAVKHFFSDFYM